jgi:hypothetical protein
MDFATYVVQLNDAIINENGPNLAYLLRPTNPHGKDLVKEFRNPTVSPLRCIFLYLGINKLGMQRASFTRFEGCIQNPWDDIAFQYVLVCTHIAKKRYGEAFKEESQLVS